MRRVSQSHVLREWLRMECHRTDDCIPVEDLSERATLDALLDRKPGAAAFVWRDSPIDWYALTLDREAFEDLHVVEGPPNLRWRALSPDDTVVGAARRIAREDADELTDETGVDVAKIQRFRDELPDGPLVLSTRQGCVPRFVADGNHRAVALALRLLAGEFSPPTAYLGVGRNPVAKPLVERLESVVREYGDSACAKIRDAIRSQER